MSNADAYRACRFGALLAPERCPDAHGLHMMTSHVSRDLYEWRSSTHESLELATDDAHGAYDSPPKGELIAIPLNPTDRPLNSPLNPRNIPRS